MAKKDVRIEYPSRGATYCKEKFGVYEYGTYPRGSVLAGQQSRRFVGQFDTLAEAQAAHPEATYNGDGASGYQAPYLNHLPEEGDPDPIDNDIPF